MDDDNDDETQRPKRPREEEEEEETQPPQPPQPWQPPYDLRAKRVREEELEDIDVTQPPRPPQPLPFVPEPDDESPPHAQVVDDDESPPHGALPAPPLGESPQVIPDDDDGDEQQRHKRARDEDAIARSYENLAALEGTPPSPLELRRPAPILTGPQPLPEQMRKGHFITSDAPEIPIQAIHHAYAHQRLRYAIWTREIGELNGHRHWHMYIELTEPQNAFWLEALLFGLVPEGTVRPFHVFIQPPKKGRYACRFYIMKAFTREPGTTYHEYGIWLDHARQGSGQRPVFLNN